MDQEVLMKLQMLYQQSQELEEHMKVVDQQLQELVAFKEQLETLAQSQESHLLAAVGKGVFIPTDIKDKKLYVDVGQGYLVRKTPEDALKVIEQQSQRLGELKVQISTQHQTITEELQNGMQQLEAAQPAA